VYQFERKYDHVFVWRSSENRLYNAVKFNPVRVHLVRSWCFPVCHTLQLPFYSFLCDTDILQLWNAFGLRPLLSQSLCILDVLDRLVSQFAPELPWFLRIWCRRRCLPLPVELSKLLSLVSLELVVLASLFMSGFMHLKPGPWPTGLTDCRCLLLPGRHSVLSGWLYTFCLWSPYVIGHTIIFSSCRLFFFFFLFSSPNLSGRRLDVCHTSTHGVALVRI